MIESNEERRDEAAELEAIFLRLRRPDIAYLKFLLESYEEVGIVRTLDRRAAVVVLLVCRDFLPIVRGLLVALADEIDFEEIAPPPDAGEDWLLRCLPPWRGQPPPENTAVPSP